MRPEMIFALDRSGCLQMARWRDNPAKPTPTTTVRQPSRAVIGVPDPRRGERSCDCAPTEDLTAHCGSLIAN
jgi:hypothetical protein